MPTRSCCTFISRALRAIVSRTVRAVAVAAAGAHDRTRRFGFIAATLALGAVTPLTASAQVDLVLNVTDSPDPVPRTGLVTYGVVISNNGLTTATGVTFTMNVPANATYGGFTVGNGAACSGMAVNQAGPGIIDCTAANVTFSTTATFSVLLRLNAIGVTSVTSSTASSAGDVDLGDNEVTNSTTAAAGADFSVSLRAPATNFSGTTFNYALTVRNAGPDAASALRVQFPIPTGFAQQGALPSGCSAAANIITCNVAGPIASGDSIDIGNIQGKIVAANGSTVSGTASVALQPGAPALTPQDPNTTNNSFSLNIAVTSGSDVRLTKARSTAGPLFIGNTFSFILTAAYDGDSPSGLTIVDTIPANYTIGTIATPQNGWTCSRSGQVVSCTRASGVSAGLNQSLGSISIPVTVASAGVAVTNRAHIASTSPTDPTLSNNVGSDGGVTLQTPAADLSLSKTGPNPALVVVGLPFTWTLTARNGGPSVFFGDMIITESIPAGVTINSYSLNGWSCDVAAPFAGPQTVMCTRNYAIGAPLGASTNAPALVFSATATATGLLTNSAVLTSANANASDPSTANNSTTHSVTASSNGNSADLRVIKTVDSTTIAAGNVLTYSIEVVNDSSGTASNVRVTDVLSSLINAGSGPVGQGFVSATVSRLGVAGPGITCPTSLTGSGTTLTLTCDIPTLPVCVATVDCPVLSVAIRPGGNGGTRTNTASVLSSSTADQNPNNNSGSVSNTISPRADVTITKSGTPNPVAAGQPLTYTVTALNNGPSQALSVTVNDTLPLGVRFVSAGPSSGSCSATPAVNTVTTVGNRLITCTLGTIASGAQQTLTIIVRPTTGTRLTSVVNVATVTTSTIEPLSPGDTNNVVTRSIAVSNPSLDLLVNKEDTIDPLTVGDNTVYRLIMSNVGPSDAENVVITDTMPAAGLSYQSHTFANGSCSVVPTVGTVGGVLVCSRVRLAAGTTDTMFVTMAGVAKGIYQNIVRISSDETVLGFEGANTSNNRSTQNTTVRTRADVQVVSKAPSAANVAVRRPYTWTIRIRNNTGGGLAEADTVRVTDSLPATMELTGTPTVNVLPGGTTTLSSCTGLATETIFTCALGTVSNGAEIDIVVPVRNLSMPAGGTSTNRARVSTFSQDVDLTNNTNTGLVTITGASLSGLVYRDFNNDGVTDPSDTGIGSVGMSLIGTAFDGTPLTFPATTIGNGSYQFLGIPEGTYTVRRGTVSESFLNVGQQSAGSSGGVATTVPDITGVALAENATATLYRFAMVPIPRLGIAKRVEGTPTVNADGSLTAVLRLAVRNFALEAMSNVTISDTLIGTAPRFGVYVAGGTAAALTAGRYTINAAPSIVGACTSATPTAAFNGDATAQFAQIASLAVGGTCEFDVSLRYQPANPLPVGNYTNQAFITGTGALSGRIENDASQNGASTDPDADGNPGNNNVPTPLNAVLAADVTTSVTLPGTVPAGQPVNGTIRFSNLGPYDAQAVGYTLTITANLGPVTFGNLPTGATASYNSANGVVTFTGMPTVLTPSQIASGDGTTPITVAWAQNGVASSGMTSGISTTSHEGANVGPNSASATVTGPLVADVTTTVAFPPSADAGTPVSGTVVFRNTGPSTASGVTYTLTLNTGLTGVSFSNLPAGATATYNSTTGDVAFTGMPITRASGAIASGNGTTGIVVNYTQNAVASTTVTSGIGTTTSQGANVAPDNATTPITGSLIVDVTTTLSFPGTVNAGNPVAGTILFRNNGPSVASGVTYAMTLTTGLSNVVFGNLPGGATATYNPTTGAVVFAGMPSSLALNQIASGNGSSGVTLSYTQPGTATSTITSTIATATNQGVNAAPDNAIANTGGLFIADVRAQVSFPTTVNAGQPVNGTVRLSNVGPSSAAGVGYVLTLTPGLTGVTFGNLPIGATAAYNPTTGAVTFTGMPTALTAGQVASGDGTTGITVLYTQNGVANSTVAATISTTTDQGANLAPDTDNAVVIGGTIADVTTSVVNFPATITPGNVVTGNIVFTNAGPSTALGTTFSATLTPGMSGVTFGNLPIGVTPSYNFTTGAIVFTGMPTSVAMGTIVSGDGVNGIRLSYTQAGVLTTLTSTIGTTTNQGANARPDSARTNVTGLLPADLTVLKTTTLTQAAPGDTISYLIRVSNNGPSAVPAGSIFSDEPVFGFAPTDVRCTTVAGNLCSAPPAVSQLRNGYSLPALAIGSIYEVTIFGTVTAQVGESVLNAGTISVPPTYVDINLSDNRSVAAVLPVRLAPDLALTKTISAPLVTGGNASYLLNIRNIGTVAATGPITLTDNLHPALSFQRAVGAGWSCSALLQAVTCTNPGPLVPGASTNIQLDVGVASTATGSIRNVAQITSPGDLRFSNDTSAIDGTVALAPDLALVKSVNTDTLRLGGTATYSLSITNRGGGATSTPILVVDTLPAGLVPTVASGTDFTCTISGQVVTCSRTTPLTAAQSVAVTVSVTVSSTLALQPLSNSACARTAGDANATNDCGSVSTPVGGRREAEVTKLAGGTFTVGQPGTFRLVIRNRGTLPLNGPLSLIDSLPPGLGFSLAQGTNWSCSSAASVVSCLNAGPIAVGDSAVVTLAVTVGAEAMPEVINCALMTAPAGTTLTNGGRSCATVRPRTGPDLTMTKTVNADTLRIGGAATWTLAVSNRGAAATTQPIVVLDSMPPALAPISATGTGFTCTVAGQVVRCERALPLGVNESVSITIVSTVRATAPLAPITNTACVRTADDVNTVNDCGTITTPTAGRREATLRKEAFGEFLVGEKGNFRIWVRNTGTVPLAGPIVVTDSLPNGLTFASATGSGWNCAANGSVVGCRNAGPIAVNDSSAIVVQATISAAAMPEATNCATLSIPGGSVLAANGRACATVRPTADYRLVLELTTPRYQRELGEVPDFTVLVRNIGRSPLPNVVVTNLLPNGFTHVAGSSTRGGRPDLASRNPIANPSGGVGPSIGWPIGDMTPGQVIRIDYRALIRTGASFNIDNITLSSAVSSVPGLRVTSNTATVPIKLQRGLFDTRGMIAGKVYVQCDCDSIPGQGDGEVGIPGVRVVMEDGTGAITDVEGKYNMLNVRAGLHVVKVDRTTLPAGATLVVLNTRNAGDANSRFVDLKAGELHRADFAEGSRSEDVLADVLRRRRAGEGSAARDSARMSAVLTAPMMMTPTTITPLTSAAPTTSVYTPLALPNMLHDGNSNLPTPPVRAQAQQAGMARDSGTGQSSRELLAAMSPVDGRRLVPAPRPFLAAGLLQARIDLRQLSRGGLDLAAIRDGFEESLNDMSFTRDSGRVRGGARGALLLKGEVKGAGLLTLAFDSEWDRERTQFRDITPDQGFPIFGDGSLREFDAQSQQRLYARLDRGASYLRYGDFATPRSDDRRLLLAYDRSLTGLTYHAEGTRGVMNGFISRNGIRQTIDELPGRGLSGPYYLAQPNAVINSERVEIVTRDRNQPALILRSQPMARFEEYTIEPLTGRLLFRAPVPSLDANLNPVSIRVSYEVAQGGAEFNTYGGDGRMRLGSRVELGGFAVRDENPLDRQTLLGLSATALLGTSTTVLGEVARTETGERDLVGDAWRVEVRHQSPRVEARLFALQGDTAFANRSSTFVGGRNEFGARVSTVLSEQTRIIGEAIRTEDVRTDGRRDGALLAIERRLSKRIVAEIGYRWADENGASVTPVLPGNAGGLFGGSGTNVSRGLTPLSFNAARARITARVPGSDKSTVFTEYEYGLDDSNAQRGAIGGEYLLLNKARLYLRHEWISSQQGPYGLSENRDQQNTVFGIDADVRRNGQIFSEYRARDAFNGRDAEASIGLRNRWQLAKGILANTTFERVAPLAGSETGRAFAATGAFEFTQSPLWKGTSRLEWRTTPAGDNLLGSLGYARKLSRDWTMLGRTLWDQMNTEQLRGRSQVGFAWRQTDRNRVNALFRLENRLDRTDAQGDSTTRTTANIAAILVNVQPSPTVTFSTRYAGKRANDQRGGLSTPSSAHLLMGRTIVDLTKRFDLGVIGSVLGNGAFSERRYGAGAEVGAVLMRNLRLAAGYNVFGFTDRDFESLGYTQRGPYLEFGFKFDESVLGAGRKNP